MILLFLVLAVLFGIYMLALGYSTWKSNRAWKKYITDSTPEKEELDNLIREVRKELREHAPN